MYTGDLPMLTKGPFAVFYGGEQLIPLLSNQPSGKSFQMIILFSLLFQILLTVYKQIEVKKLNDYTIMLKRTMVHNILNVYGIFIILFVFIISFFYIIRHTIYIEKNRIGTEAVNFIPWEIVFIYCFAGSLVIFPFLRSHALRFETI